MNMVNKLRNTISSHAFLTRRMEQKIKNLNHWKEKYLTALKEVKEIRDSLNKIISDSEAHEVKIPPREIEAINTFSAKELLKELGNRYGRGVKVQIEGNKCWVETDGKRGEIIFDIQEEKWIDLRTVNDKTDIPKAPPPPPKKVEEIKKDPATSRADLNREIQDKVREGVKPSDLKKKKDE